MKARLNEIKKGERCRVLAVSEKARAIEARLRALGFTSGVRVEKTMTSPLGDPSSYLVRGSVIALRDCDAALITVITEESYEN